MNIQTKLILNPTAGKGGAGQNMPNVLAQLEKRGFAHDLILTEQSGHALQAARQAAEAGCPLVVAAGGDGTINEVINGLMQAELNGSPRPALGVLPIGTGNDFAYGVNIPAKLEDAIDTLVQDKRRTIDVGRVSGGDYPAGRYFVNGVGMGFDTVVGLEAIKIKWLRGAASYLAGLISAIFIYAKAPTYEVTLDGGRTLRQPFLMVSVMNGRRMGGSFLMAPESDPADGVFDLCLANHVPQIRILPLALKFIQGTQKGNPAVNMTRSTFINVEAITGSIPAHADGETLCAAGQSLRIELIPSALAVVTRPV